MAKRKQLWHPEDVRAKIQASQLINRLTDHINSPTPLMDSTQVTAAIKLLGKVLPDLSSVEGSLVHSGEVGVVFKTIYEAHK